MKPAIRILFAILALLSIESAKAHAADINTLRFEEGIVVQLPNSWIIQPGDKSSLFTAVRYDDNDKPFALLRIAVVRVSIGVTHNDINKMTASERKNFLSGFVPAYLKSVNSFSDIKDRKVLVSEINELNGFSTIAIISSGIAAGKEIIVSTKMVGFKGYHVQLTLWATRNEFEKNIKEFTAIGESFIPGKK